MPAAREAKSVAPDDKYQRQVNEALDDVLEHTIAQEEGLQEPFTLNLAADHRYIIFSDHHRGTRDKADDFRQNERAYNAALAYYYHTGYTLLALGDVEELWKDRVRSVMKAYEHTLALEARFHEQGRYLRFWGNHDDAWSHEDLVEEHLAPHFGSIALKVHEGLRFKVVQGHEELGHLFFIHGQQGERLATRFAWFSRFVVRYFWRPFQRLTGIALNTPAKSWELRQKLNIAMSRWAAQQDKLILVAGHTHYPVFESKTHAAQVEEALRNEELRREKDFKKIALLQAELEWILTQERRTGDGGPPAPSKPCYFNTGCCCFNDGDVTGIEITDGEIRLVRWPDDKGRPRPKVLARSKLAEDFKQC